MLSTKIYPLWQFQQSNYHGSWNRVWSCARLLCLFVKTVRVLVIGTIKLHFYSLDTDGAQKMELITTPSYPYFYLLRFFASAKIINKISTNQNSISILLCLLDTVTTTKLLNIFSTNSKSAQFLQSLLTSKTFYCSQINLKLCLKCCHYSKLHDDACDG